MVSYMIILERTSVMDLGNAIRGARDSMNSWEWMDSSLDENDSSVLGPNDLDLTKRSRRAGSDHRKHLHQVFVSVDIVVPLHWWKGYDTYRVATVVDSTSTTYKVHSKPFEPVDFSVDRMAEGTLTLMETMIVKLGEIRLKHMTDKNEEDWYNLIQLLPSSYNQVCTCTLNYKTLVNIYYVRRSYKLAEWRTFCNWIRTLPYARELAIAEAREME